MNAPTNKLPALIDSHVHTDDERFESDLQDVLIKAQEANVIAQIVPAVSRNFWPRLKHLCSAYDQLYASYGLHPCFCDRHNVQDIEELALWLGREQPVAVGECGLDYTEAAIADKAFQQQLFSAQLALAREFNLPVIIHARKAVEDVINLIRASGHTRGVVHSFNGSYQQAQRLIDSGYKLSFGGAVTFDRAKRLRDLFARLPLEAILLETDAPDQPDSAHHGQRNEPAYLRDVWLNLSELRQETAHQIAVATTQNAIDLFELDVDAG